MSELEEGSATSRESICVSWDLIPDEPVRPGVRRRGFGTDDCLLVRNECSPGMTLNPHSHDVDQLGLITAGEGFFYIGGEKHHVGPGSVMFIAAGVEHYLVPVGDEPVVNIDVFAPARTDYRHLLDWMDGGPSGLSS